MNIRIQSLCVGLVLAVVLFGHEPAFPQSATTGALSGTITDVSGAVVPDVEVTATHEASGAAYTATSSSVGVYRIALLRAGSYTVEAKKTGFKLARRTGVVVVVTEITQFNFKLELGAVSQEVTVTANATLLQSESGAVGRVIGEQAVSNLPLVSRNFAQILALSPGIMTSVSNAAEVGRGTDSLLGPHAHGARFTDNSFQMDGMGVNDTQGGGNASGGLPVPNPDTIQEFKVQTALYDAAFGRNAGASVQIVTKGGTNDFHASVFEFFRNEALNANEFFTNLAGQKKGILRQNQFGFTAGGPLRPNKVLVFGSYQGTRQRNGISAGGRQEGLAGQQTGVCVGSGFGPQLTDDRSPAALGAIFAGLRGQNQINQGNVGPAVAADGSNIHPVALRILQAKTPDGKYAVPTPQTLDLTRNVQSRGFSVFSDPCRSNEDQYMANVDVLQTTASKISARTFVSQVDTTETFTGGNVPGWRKLNLSRFRTFSLSHGYVASPRLFNEARFGFHRNHTTWDPSGPFKYSDVGILGAGPSDPYVQLALGTLRLGNATALGYAQNNFTGRDDASYTRGRHNLRFGGEVARVHNSFINLQFPAQVSFATFADFLLGLDASRNGTQFSNISSTSVLSGLTDRAWRIWDGGLYFQDDWKISSRLNVNLGFRYERLGHMSDLLGRNGNFDIRLVLHDAPTTGSYAGFVIPSNYIGTTPPQGVVTSDNTIGLDKRGENNWAPRVGFAWRVLPNSSRLVLRGGGGTYYSHLTGQPLMQRVSAPPFVVSAAGSGTILASATLDNPFLIKPLPQSQLPFFPAYFPTPSGVNPVMVEGTVRPPITHQFGLNLQTELTSNLMLEVGYVGARSTHLVRGRNLNQAFLASPSNPIRGETTNTVANAARRTPYSGFAAGGLRQVETSGSSWYNGMEVSLTKRMSRGVQFLASYTWSKTLDSDAANSTQNSNGSNTLGNQNDPRSRWGRAQFDRPHRFVFSYVWDLPSPSSLSSFLGQTLGGWSFSGVTTIQSGSALTLGRSSSTNIFAIGGDLATMVAGCTHDDLVTEGTVHSKRTNYFNRSCFGNPAVIGSDNLATAFGNLGPGVVNGPDQRNFDMALYKTFALRERTRLQFRTEFYNAFNTTQFGNPVTGSNAADFGTISFTTVNPRIIQFALKLYF
jgi:hypothetical protein